VGSSHQAVLILLRGPIADGVLRWWPNRINATLETTIESDCAGLHCPDCQHD